MGIEITTKGADRNDSGPKGVIARYLEAVAAQDETALSDCLTEESRKIYGLEQTALTDCTVTIGEAISLTGANRNTLKQHFRGLLERGPLALRGSGRGAWYELR